MKLRKKPNKQHRSPVLFLRFFHASRKTNSHIAPMHTKIKSFMIFLTNSRISRIHIRKRANKVQPVKAMMHRRIHITYVHRTINVIIKYICHSSLRKSFAYCAQFNAPQQCTQWATLWNCQRICFSQARFVCIFNRKADSVLSPSVLWRERRRYALKYTLF